MMPDAPRSLMVALALLIAASPAVACRLTPQGDGRIASVVDAWTLRLDDGRDIRLAGLAPLPPAHAARAMATLQGLVGQTVILSGDSDAPDRYGRQALLVQREAIADTVQSELLSAGDALTRQPPTACLPAFRAAEARARRAGSGVWRDAEVIKNAEMSDGISAGTGRFMIVEGRVISVRQVRQVIYINFGRRWTRDFAVTIPGRALPSFVAAGLQPQGLTGQQLRIRGFAEQRGGQVGNSRGGPRIEAIRPEQIEIVGATDVAGASE